MVTIEELVKHIKSRVKIHDLVFNAFKDVIVSEKPTVEINSQPIPKSEFENTGNGVVEYYDRALNPFDMFGGQTGSGVNYPIIDTFNIDQIPNILGGNLGEKIKITNK